MACRVAPPPIQMGSEITGRPNKFLWEWAYWIHRHDAEGFRAAGCRVWNCLTMKVRDRAKKTGRGSWSAKQFMHAQPVWCVCLCDGTKENQKTILPHHEGNPQVQPGQRMWPCIVIFRAPVPGLVLFYCPALAWARARPWEIHTSRVFPVGTFFPYIENDIIPPELPNPIAPESTTGATGSRASAPTATVAEATGSGAASSSAAASSAPTATTGGSSSAASSSNCCVEEPEVEAECDTDGVEYHII